MHVAAIIVAAGRGERAGASQPKQFVDLGGGRTMLDMSIDVFLATPEITEVIVAVPPGYMNRVATSPRVRVVEGGARRQDSMARAFAAIADAAEVVLVHDAARPYVSSRLIVETIDAAAMHGAAIVALPVRDTVKRTASTAGQTTVRETLPRDEIVLAQTPQGFRREVLEHALAAAAHLDVTDESMLVERAGIPVHVVRGEPANVKITTAEDLMIARTQTSRIGTGYDLHRLVQGRPLILGGVRIPSELGLQGHSDADIVCHAVTDAILGAAALGDIGRMFPDSDPKWKDADSIELLRAAAEAVRSGGYTVSNVDVTVIAERPKLLPYVPEMRANVAAALGIDAGAVSIKGKTNETVDATGRGEAMACHAVALLTLQAARVGF
jgi:2-C-methyl-D-erythritol 4-phosphate cytidylyltransferase / 2-C-methyl-D-erythritol 2,4-cyclodiphosphate synthase